MKYIYNRERADPVAVNAKPKAKTSEKKKNTAIFKPMEHFVSSFVLHINKCTINKQSEME